MTNFECFDYDEFEEDDLEQDNSLNSDTLLFATGFLGELKYIVKNYIINFFKNEKFSEGGKIPNSILLDKNNISMVMNYDINRGVKEAYELLANRNFSNISSSKDSGDIGIVLEILNKLSKSNIPQQFAGGMIVLYIKLVEGA